MLGLRYDVVELWPYCPGWPNTFAEEADTLRRGLVGFFREVEHFGSTSVPGMPAKPIIDILVGVNEPRNIYDHVLDLAALDYGFLGECGRSDRYFLVKGGPKNTTHHLHVVKVHSAYWQDGLLFRDYLRSNEVTARVYAGLKRELARAFPGDRAAYRFHKGEFVERTLVQARRYG